LNRDSVIPLLMRLRAAHPGSRFPDESLQEYARHLTDINLVTLENAIDRLIKNGPKMMPSIPQIREWAKASPVVKGRAEPKGPRFEVVNGQKIRVYDCSRCRDQRILLVHGIEDRYEPHGSTVRCPWCTGDTAAFRLNLQYQALRFARADQREDFPEPETGKPEGLYFIQRGRESDGLHPCQDADTAPIGRKTNGQANSSHLDGKTGPGCGKAPERATAQAKGIGAHFDERGME
jgi:hypothetical protein